MTNYLHKVKGNVSVGMLVGWGLTLAIATVGGIAGTIAHTDSKVEETKVSISDVKVDVATLNADSAQYRRDIDAINSKLDQLLWAQGIKPPAGITSSVIR